MNEVQSEPQSGDKKEIVANSANQLEVLAEKATVALSEIEKSTLRITRNSNTVRACCERIADSTDQSLG
jgi:hypothetical protein